MKRNTGSILFLGILALILFLLLTGCTSQTTITPEPEATRDPDLERSIEQQLEKINPEAVPVYQQATIAMDSGDYASSRELYTQVIEMAPGFSTAYRRLGYIEMSLNNIDLAEELSRKALELEINSYNQSALSLVLLQKDTPRDSQEAFELASSSVDALPDDEQANLALMLSAVALKKLEIAAEANQRLLQKLPGNPLVHYFAGLLAASDGKWVKAEAELLYSQQLGMDAEVVQEALDEGISRNAMLARFFRWGIIATILWLVGLGFLYLTGTPLSKATIRAINETKAVSDNQISSRERTLRSIYRSVIIVLSLYFYISIPFVIILLLLLVGGVFYLFLMVGRIPIQIAGILLVILVASLIAIMRGVFSRPKDTPPGRPLKLNDAPELWAFVEKVASKLDVRPVDEIYATPFASIAVTEKGSILRKLRGGGRRHLLLGISALSGLTQGQFAAILAHEYGHFSNRDTAGGNLAHQVYASLDQIARRLALSGATQMYNPVWLFVLGYQRIYLRVTLGASRLQEVLADRFAVIAYGNRNFIEGLRNIIRQTIVFQLQANFEIKKALELNRGISNIYDLPIDDELQDEIKKHFDETMQRTTSQYDSHPAPQERIRLIERLQVPLSFMHDDQRSAILLLPNPEDLQREMTTQILKNVRLQAQKSL